MWTMTGCTDVKHLSEIISKHEECVLYLEIVCIYKMIVELYCRILCKVAKYFSTGRFNSPNFNKIVQ